MGLFLLPTSGHAVGGGGHGIGDPPPQGVDVDAVGRVPLRLLRKTMNKHKPKYMNIVPPGLFRGAIAPPYAWEPRERDDWEYRAARRFSKSVHEATLSAPGIPNPAKARIDAIHQQIMKIREEIRQLLDRRRALVQAGKQHLAPKPTTPADPPPAGHWKGTPADPSGYAGHWGAHGESLSRAGLRLLGEKRDFTDLDSLAGPAEPKQPAPIPAARQRKTVAPVGRDEHGAELGDPGERAGHELPSYGSGPRSDTMFKQFTRERRHALNLPLGLSGKPPAPPQSPEIIQIHQQVAAKRQQIATLVNQLKQLRTQPHHESSGLTHNRRSCLRLLLK